MKIKPSKRLQSTGAYAFAEVDRAVERLKSKGIEPTDFGVGDPTSPTPEFIREAGKRAIDIHKSSGYPSYAGSPAYREAVAEWTRKRFGVELDPEKEICSTIGSKEAVFNFPECIIDPGDVVLIPNPGYPPYSRGTLFAEGVPRYLPILAENDFLPDLDSVPDEILKRAKLLWVNYPNSPTGACAPLEFLERVVELGHRHNIIIASDEAYSEIYFGEPPHSALEVSKDGVVVFQSLSKRSAMTGWRIGWVAGDERIISLFKKLKTNIDSGTPNFVQEAALAALSDEEHTKAFREEYRAKRDIMVQAFKEAGLPECIPEATIYIWQRVPEGMNSVEFATRLLEPEIAIVTTPGAWLGEQMPDGSNPGEGYIRLALVPSMEETRLAGERLKNGLGSS